MWINLFKIISNFVNFLLEKKIQILQPIFHQHKHVESIDRQRKK